MTDTTKITEREAFECQNHANCGDYCETDREREMALCEDCLDGFDRREADYAELEKLRQVVGRLPECPAGYELVALPIDYVDQRQLDSCETLGMALELLDFGLAFALCNRDHGGTRRDVKKAKHWLAEVKRLLSFQSATLAVPDGYALVPIEPTPAMIEAAFVGKVEAQSVLHQQRARAAMADNYRAIIAAAPAPVQQTEECFCVEHGLHIESLQKQLGEAHALLLHIRDTTSGYAHREQIDALLFTIQPEVPGHE